MIQRFAVSLPESKLESFCQRWKVGELSLFGSALRDDFRPESDVDFLIEFQPETEWDLFDFFRMEDELSEIFDRRVDLVTRRSLERSANLIRRQAIFNSAVPIYVA